MCFGGVWFAVVCFLITYDNASLVDMSSQGESLLRPREPKIKGERERERETDSMFLVCILKERRRGEEQRRKKESKERRTDLKILISDTAGPTHHVARRCAHCSEREAQTRAAMPLSNDREKTPSGGTPCLP